MNFMYYYLSCVVRLQTTRSNYWNNFNGAYLKSFKKICKNKPLANLAASQQ